MTTKKICKVCGQSIDIDTNKGLLDKSLFQNKGAQIYYCMWHFNIERCPNCNYSSKDVSVCNNKEIVKSDAFKNILENKLLTKLNHYRLNNIIDYLLAGEYYLNQKDLLNYSLCYLQASDNIFYEIINFEDQICDFELTEEDENFINDLKSLSKSILNKSIDSMKIYIWETPTDYKYKILLLDILVNWKHENSQLVFVLKKDIKNANLSYEEKVLLDYLFKPKNNN